MRVARYFKWHSIACVCFTGRKLNCHRAINFIECELLTAYLSLNGIQKREDQVGKTVPFFNELIFPSTVVME